MAFVDSASAVVVTTATAGCALVAARRTRGLVREFTLVLFGLSAFDVLLWIVTPLFYGAVVLLEKAAPAFGFDSLTIPIVALLAAPNGPWMVLHLPSIVVLGFDENLERYGPLVTSVGLVVDYFIWAVLVELLVRAWRGRARWGDGSPRPDHIHGRPS